MTGADSNNITLGKVHSSNNDKSVHDYILLGDPTLQLKLKQVHWSCDVMPGCFVIPPTNTHNVHLDCSGENEMCLECRTGFTWDGSACVAD